QPAQGADLQRRVTPGELFQGGVHDGECHDGRQHGQDSPGVFSRHVRPLAWAKLSPILRPRRRMNPTDTKNPDYYHRVVDCQWACPAHTDVPEYIRLIAQGRFTDAYMVNRASNVFPGILGRVCDRPCEP